MGSLLGENGSDMSLKFWTGFLLIRWCFQLIGLCNVFTATCFLKNCNSKDCGDEFNPSIDDYRSLNRGEYFYLPGVILHIDGDKDYLDKCMSFYKNL